MPSRWEVELSAPALAPAGWDTGLSGVAIPLTAPQAVVSGWLDDPPARRAGGGSADPSRSGHGDQARKWACGPLRASADAMPGSPGGAITLRVRLLDDRLADRLRGATPPGRRVRLGQRQFKVTQPARLIEQASWQELRRWSGARAWQVRFATPACFRRGARTSPWPAPESVWRGLAQRWRLLHPDNAPPAPGPGAASVWVSDIDGRSEVCTLTRNVRRNGSWRLEDEVIAGFAGRIRYVCDPGADDHASAFGAILAFASFAGAGSHTTYGFGVVLPEPTWQPPASRAAGL
jgi:CRISPR-associated endoribonuclease Cas6